MHPVEPLSRLAICALSALGLALSPVAKAAELAGTAAPALSGQPRALESNPEGAQASELPSSDLSNGPLRVGTLAVASLDYLVDSPARVRLWRTLFANPFLRIP